MMLMKTVCKIDLCTGCKACLERCNKNAIRIVDSLKCFNAVIDETKCIGCNACVKICQKEYPLKLTKPVSWYQGWITDENARSKSSSGGFAYGLMKQFIADGGYVCSCLFSDGRIVYKITSDEKCLTMYRGSKYVKSDPEGIYSKVIGLLNNGNKVLFIGLPCHIAALVKLTGDKFKETLYTVDLICHGSPSFAILEKYIKEHRINISNIQNISFRDKNKFHISLKLKKKNGCKDISLVSKTVRDRYTVAFLNGLFYTENCYECQYAGLERVSDITIGDSWGSDLEQTVQGSKGISLALCQTEKGSALLKKCDFELLPVDIENAIKANHQLKKPMAIPPERIRFFSLLERGKTVSGAVRICYPKICLRQDIKNVLVKLHLKKN